MTRHTPFGGRLLALVLLAVAAVPVRAADLAAEMDELDALGTVSGAAVGLGGTPGAFHTLAKSFLAKGSAADFDRLANDKTPVARAMGLYCIARSATDPAARGLAVRTLSARAGDAESFTCFPGGCVGRTMTVGELASHLLRDRNYLEMLPDETIDPLLDPAAVFGQDVLMLAADGQAAGGRRAEYDPADSVRRLLAQGLVRLDGPTVAGLCPGEPRWRVVKGVGRAEPGPAVREFLAARLRDDRERPEVRLAAASALTRDPDPAARRALADAAGFLNKATADAALGDRLVAAADLRAKLAALNAGLFGGPPKDVADALRAADHPLALDYRPKNANGLFLDPAADWEADMAQFVRMSARLGEFIRPWDTYTDAPYCLAVCLGDDDSPDARLVRRRINRAIRQIEQ